jgi:hypothetical protein
MSKDTKVVNVDVAKAGKSAFLGNQLYKAVATNSEGKTTSYTSDSREHAIRVAANNAKGR